ncbi:MAG: TadE/TadG family type IV pilus assembly protein [Paracoccaceae bacterium]
MTGLRAFFADEAGTATIEFLFVIPIVMMIFMASMESSLFMARSVMLERSVDIVVRDIRLGVLDDLTHAQLKRRICETSALVYSVDTCVDAMRIWMQPINTADFAMVAPPRSCVDRSAPIDPLQEPTGAEFMFGVDNEIMLMRICLKEEPMFPTTVIGASLIRDETDGNYALLTTTVFVNEPG